ncbi:MAG: hypothetical protein HYX28_05140 [Candidatus Koribacter versatilis]|uniref:Uncharacterized protein n=1 Tax=Candidatus Korobacter versatilis TaxID=658062 RepID=A0A932EQS9_9BACT|nr:hypothetical protein [Candidatus Koribacter versatilis]
MSTQPTGAAAGHYMTLCGLPVTIHMNWPFHPAVAGSDFFVLHGRMSLAVGSGESSHLHAEIALQLTQVIKEALPSLDREHSEPAVVNAIRKDLDRKQLELVKSGKRQPVTVSSRHYNFKQNRLAFGTAPDDEIVAFIRRKVFWLSKLAGGQPGVHSEVRVAEPLDLLYLNTTAEHMLELAQRDLAAHGLITLAKGFAAPGEKLLSFAHQIEHELKESLHALEEKHRFEKEGATHF